MGDYAGKKQINQEIQPLNVSAKVPKNATIGSATRQGYITTNSEDPIASNGWFFFKEIYMSFKRFRKRPGKDAIRNNVIEYHECRGNYHLKCFLFSF